MSYFSTWRIKLTSGQLEGLGVGEGVESRESQVVAQGGEVRIQPRVVTKGEPPTRVT